MVLPSLLIVVILVAVVLFRHLARKRDEGHLWPAALGIGVAVGMARALLAPLGWYVVEHTGGPLQVPAYVLVMLAWPEAVLFRGHRGPAGPGFLLRLGLVLLGSSVLAVSAIALVVQVVHRTNGRSRAAGSAGPTRGPDGPAW